MRYPIFLVGLVLLVQSCTLQQAQKSFDKGEFDRAITLYEKKLTPTDPVVNYQIAEAYRKSNRLKEAGPYYSAAVKAGSDEEALPYQYARSLKANERYDEAKDVLQEYVVRPDADEKLLQMARYELENLHDLRVIEETPNYFRIKNLEDLNTSKAEYSPVYKDGQLYFTSNRNSNRIYLVTGTPFTDIFMVQTRGANVNIKTLKPLDPVINHDDTNEGSIAMFPDGASIIFAKGNTGKATGNTEVNLYFTRYRNGQWLEPRPLSINDPDAWDSTPALTPDGQTLYFASTREGGYGGADIYSAQLNRRGRWVDVKNLGPDINTSGEEVFPFVGEDGRLYFASDGHPGFGNLDLFMATRERGKITVENLGEPMNSEADDFGLYQFDPIRGFFTSNRPGGKGDDDIYTYVNDDPNLRIVNYYLEGVTVTTDDGGKEIILPNTKVSLVAESGEVVEESFTGDDGVFRFRVYTEEQYDLIGEKTDYFTTRKPFSTVGKSVDKSTLTDFITNVEFESKIMMERIVIEKPIVLNNIYYDLDKADIRPDAAIVLDSLVEIMNDNPEIYVELGSHTDARADDNYNIDLSFRRARSAVQYMIRNGVAPERITAKGYGETQLIIKNAKTEEQHQVNRRTEFKVLRYNPKRQEEARTDEGVIRVEDGTNADDGESDEYDRFFDE